MTQLDFGFAFNIIDFINANNSTMIKWVVEFFEGKYTKEQVEYYLYKAEPDTPRAGVLHLANEFNILPSKDIPSIREWYESTDFYVFDLLPWNGSGQFKQKVDAACEFIDRNDIQTIADFGGGLGIAALYISQKLGRKVYYVDLKGGVTHRFAEFLFDKFNANIEMLGDQEFLNSNIRVECIVSLDCFEHIPNMEQTFERLITHSNIIWHDSQFFTDPVSPQHVYTPKLRDFLNMCLTRNYVPLEGGRVLWLARMQLKEDDTLEIQYAKK